MARHSFVFFALLFSAAAAHSTCASGAAGSCPTAEAAKQEENEDQSLLALRFGPLPPSPVPTPKPPPSEDCFYYSHSFPTSKQGKGGKGAISFIVVRQIVVDMETAAFPHLLGDGVVESDFFFTANNPYDGKEQIPGIASDQYYLYLMANLTGKPIDGDPEWTVVGLYPNSAWLYLELTYSYPDGSTEEVDLRLASVPDAGAGRNTLEEVIAPKFETFKTSLEEVALHGLPKNRVPAANPFDAGNPTVLTWGGQAKCVTVSGRRVPGRSSFAATKPVPRGPPNVRCRDSPHLARVVRLPKDVTQQTGLPAGEDGCASEFMISPGKDAARAFNISAEGVGTDFKYGFMQFQIPAFQDNSQSVVQTGLMNETNPDGYDLGYFSVSSQWIGGKEDNPGLPWSVNSIMLAAQAAGKNDALILFAPVDAVKLLPRSAFTAPPEVDLPLLKRKAYVMYAPNFAFLFRYASAAPMFKGSPPNAACKDSVIKQYLSPVSCLELGAFKPMITPVTDATSVEDLVKSVEVSVSR